jgi:hypothetical protein
MRSRTFAQLPASWAGHVRRCKILESEKILPPTDAKREVGRSTDRSPLASSTSPSHTPYCPGATTTTKVRSQTRKNETQLCVELLTIFFLTDSSPGPGRLCGPVDVSNPLTKISISVWSQSPTEMPLSTSKRSFFSWVLLYIRKVRIGPSGWAGEK